MLLPSALKMSKVAAVTSQYVVQFKPSRVTKNSEGMVTICMIECCEGVHRNFEVPEVNMNTCRDAYCLVMQPHVARHIDDQ